ncbi:TY-Chap domain-containing protein [Cryptosporangium arvum]|uniref:TY-Chap N-terminal domain-containing protein n=1 Tax=Cryptosporangium arvum DSM 44712 TaxID=927661 RepID=A0A010Z4S3_9ACTN|nr:hypothetical protein [Cryptosporangium arvum]EXG82348.1 hypothetical protein CryarDRAFT_3524 [Cryptosporangium arvum DSM 44712]
MPVDRWAALSEALALGLTRLAIDDFLVLDAAAGYVQCYQHDDRLLTEALDTGDPRLRELGWGDPDEVDQNLSVVVAWPFSHGAACELAERWVRTLRDVYDADPNTLRYLAANASSNDDWDAGYLGIAQRLDE